MSDRDLKKELAQLLIEKETRLKYNVIDSFFPDEGPYRRELYPKHLEFMDSGKDYPERAFIAANRVGKTFTGGIELNYHVTGKYPKWWTGKRFKRPIKAWVGSITPVQMKEAVQAVLFGSFADKGTGLIAKKDLQDDDGTIRTWNMPGVPNVVGTCLVRHYDEDGVFDGWSQIEFKTYEQGWEKFQGARVDVIWLDEEPKDHKIYSECVTRTAGDTGETGIIYCTFTPLLGFSDTVLSFLPNGRLPRNGEPPEAPWKKVINAGWDDVPHLDEEWKQQRLSSYSTHERDARTKGIPTKGSGAIYPYDEEQIIVAPFEIPVWFRRAYGMDVGWNRTAVVWGAEDPDTGVIYLYSEHYRGQAEPAIHASAIRGRGEYIPGAVDPRADHRSQADGTRLIDIYEREHLDLIPADNAVEAGIYKIQQMLASGRLKVFNTLSNWITEFRIYRRDENGKIVKKDDHLMDATRYLIMTGMDYAVPYPDEDSNTNSTAYAHDDRDELTGY